jgi:hypothetical protein
MTDVQTTREEQNAAYLASKLDAIKRYLDTGDIGSFIYMDACGAIHSLSSPYKSRANPATLTFEKKWIKVYAEVHAAVADIAFKGKEFELKHWMGFCDEDVKALLKLRRRWNHFDWENETKEAGDTMRDLWNPSPDYLNPERDRSDESYWRKSWQPYIDRRDKKPLQETLAEHRSHLSAELPKMKVMMGASAGRVLLTLQDRFKQGDPESIYGGAWVTLIFDETAGHPRGGLQGQCATRDEAVALIQAVIDDMPKLVEDQEVWIA